MALRHEETYPTGAAVDLTPIAAVPRDGDVDVVRDRLLVQRCQRGDQEAFDELYEHYRRRLQRYCVRRLCDPGEAEDVVQETFARAWRALPRFSGERRFYPWLTVIANHLCVDAARRNARQTPMEESRLQATDIGCYETEDAVLLGVDAALVSTAFAKLSARHRRVLQLREGSEWSYRQIAEHEGVGITAVEALLWRARQALKREFLLLDGQKGRLAGFAVGSLGLLRTRLLPRLAVTLRRPVGAVHHLVRHLGAGVDRFFSPSGALGAFGPVAAATTGVVVLGMGALAVAPEAAPASPVAPGHALPIRSLPLPFPGAPGSSQGATGAGASTGGPATVPTPPVGSGTPTGSPQPTAASPAGPVTGAAGVTGTVGSAASATAGGVGSTATGTLNGVGTTVGGAVTAVGTTVGGAVSGVTGVVATVGSGVVAAVTQTVDAVTGALGLPPVPGAPSPTGSPSSTVPPKVPGLGG